MQKLAMLAMRSIALVGLLCAALAARAADGPIPIEDFFRHPVVTGAKLSPDGKRLGIMLAGAGGRIVLGVADLEKKEKSKVVASLAGADVRSFYWVNDRRLVFDAIDLASPGGDQYGAGLFAIDIDGTGFRPLVRRSAGATELRTVESRELTWNHRLLTTLRDGSDDIIVQRYNYDARDQPLGTTLLRVDTQTGLSKPITLGAPDGAWIWLVDATGEPRAVVSIDRETARMYWRDSASAPWKLVHEAPWFDAWPVRPVAVDGAGALYVVATRDDAARTSALYRYDTARNRIEGDALVALAGFDFGGRVLFDNERRKLIGARYTSDADGTVWFDPAWKQLQERVDKLLPATTNTLSCGRCEESPRVLVRSSSDRQSPAYWIFDTQANTLKPIGAERPWIDPKAMAERNFVRIKARDGLDLPVYVTQPRTKGPWPAVVLVHEGPFMRTNWEWQAESQFLASRGYLVIEPQFRGSSGFGAEHLRAGFKQWGLAMQDDIADAALWAVQRGLAERDRMCIAGGDYGGYAALMGLVRHPDLYRCGVDWIGATDVDLMYSITWSDASEIWRRHGMPVLIGDRDKDAAQLAATSPLKQASKINQPVLMAYGGSDRHIPIEHGTRFRDAVSRHNKDVEWIEYPDEGHGFLLVRNKVDFWKRVDAFLARSLKPRPSSTADAVQAPGS